MPDCIIKSSIGQDPGEYWACLVDAKSRTKGFDIGTNSRRAMDYYIKEYKKTISGANPYPSRAFLFVSSYFLGNVDKKLADLEKQDDMKGACISANNLLYLLDTYLNNPGKVSHKKILELLNSGTEITKLMIDKTLA